jgi:hypothetical protein
VGENKNKNIRIFKTLIYHGAIIEGKGAAFKRDAIMLKIICKTTICPLRVDGCKYIGFAFLAAFFLFATGCNNGSKQPNHKSADSKLAQNDENTENVAKKFFELETKEDYIRQYELLSLSGKNDLAQKHQVTTAEQYRDYRFRLEATWSEFAIADKMLEGDKKTKLKGHAKVEESGESSIVNFTITIVKEGTEWKVDRFEY